MMVQAPATLETLAASIAELTAFVTRALPELRDEMEQHFEEVDQRFENIDQRFERIDQKFEGVDQGFQGIDQRFERMDRRLCRVEDRLTDLSTGQREITKRLESVEGETQALHSDVVELYQMATM